MTNLRRIVFLLSLLFGGKEFFFKLDVVACMCEVQYRCCRAAVRAGHRRVRALAQDLQQWRVRQRAGLLPVLLPTRSVAL